MLNGRWNASGSRVLALLALLTALGLSARAWGSVTATVTISGAEQPGDVNGITLSFNGFTETVPYGPYSTPASIASAFGAVFSRDYLPAGLCAIASGKMVSFKLQSGSFGALSVTGPTNSFQVASSGFASQESTADSGTITLTVGGVVAAQTNYGAGATLESVAEGLAAGVTPNSYVTVVAEGGAVQLQSKQVGSTTNYSYTLGTTSYDSTDFAQPSFMNPPASGTLAGGADQSNSGTQPPPTYSYAASYDGASNVTGIADSVMGTSTFNYDSRNRLSAEQVTAGLDQGLQANWSYDSFGNRTAETFSGTAQISVPANTSATYNANNQVSSTSVMPGGGPLGYDAAGDVTNDGSNQYLYNAEGRICAVENLITSQMTGYLYDAAGNRVAKGTIANMSSCDPAVNGFQVSSEADSILDQQGRQMTETALDPGTGKMVSSHANVWFLGELLATYSMNSSGDPLYFYFNDPLGTRRVEIDYAGNVQQTCSNLPFGNGESCQPTPSGHLFTGKERDAESGNDYFGARYYGSSMGRFLSPDPSGLYYADPRNPQSLNLYNYVYNNPLTNIDPSGMECVWDDGSYDASDDPETGSASDCSDQGGMWVPPDVFESVEGNQAGSWSGQANSSIASDWLTPSATVDGAPLEPGTTYPFDVNTTLTSFLQTMGQNGIGPSQDNNLPAPIRTFFHNGTSLRDSNQFCSLHVIIDPGAGQNGKPVTGTFHYDSVNPFGPASLVSLISGGPSGAFLTIPAHGAADVIPDLLQKYVNGNIPSGNDLCPPQ